ncbi:MAG TPA: hypothetical protein V6D20_17330 [Candidatus Obscuribacterales bacterium]
MDEPIVVEAARMILKKQQVVEEAAAVVGYQSHPVRILDFHTRMTDLCLPDSHTKVFD